MDINGTNFTFGCDPELFVKCRTTGQFVSGHNLIAGTKHAPFKVEKGAVQVDGLALEFNIDPAEDFQMFTGNIDTVQSILADMIGDHEFMSDSSVIFDQKLLDEVPIEHKILGCEEDYNAWTLLPNKKPDESSLMRTAGGHIHIGGFPTDTPFAKEHFETCARLARILDERVGVPSLVWDGDDNRRAMYGQAGCFRPKPYGMEYRTLSNRWVFDRAARKRVFDGTVDAIHQMFDMSYEPSEEVQQVINNSDRTHPLFLAELDQMVA